MGNSSSRSRQNSESLPSQIPAKPLSKMPTVRKNDPIPSYTNIAAIDFGTTYCSLAFKTAGDSGVTVMRLDGTDQRVPNAILLKVIETESVCTICKLRACTNQGKCDADYAEQERQTAHGKESVSMPRRTPKRFKYKVNSFGHLAQRNYQLLRRGNYESHIYLERVKLAVMQKEGVHRAAKVEAINGREFFLVEVIAVTLKHLKEKLLDELNRRGHTGIKSSNFLWVITVPAIMGVRGKQVMREAAYLAGLCSDDKPGITSLTSAYWQIDMPDDEKHPERVILALEPEAAALSCQQLSQEQIADYCEATSAVESQQSLRYMVVDIGGGTVDIAAHQIQLGHRGPTSKVILPPKGNQFGGTAVNRAFQDFLAELVHQDRIASLTEKGEKHRALLNGFFYLEFEKEKVQFGDSIEARWFSDTKQLESEMHLRLDPKLCEAFGEDLMKISSDHPQLTYVHDDQHLHIRYTKVKELFQLAVDGILECTKAALEDLGEVDVIYLVGGFGGCKYIYSQVKTALEAYSTEHKQGAIRVIVPREPNLAVVKGAVLFGSNPQAITGRIADATYGMAVSIPYTKEHDEAFKYKDARGRYWSDDVFCVCVEKGESIASDCVFTQTLTPANPTQKEMKLELFVTDKAGVQYIRDKDGERIVERLGCVLVKLPLTSSRADRTVNVTIDFSDTEIKARAHFVREVDDCKDIKVIIDCL